MEPETAMPYEVLKHGATIDIQVLTASGLELARQAHPQCRYIPMDWGLWIRP